VFMGIVRREYLLTDVNADLIALYRALVSEPVSFIERCRALFVPSNSEQGAYAALRERFNGLEQGDPDRASVFVYLNRHCFNGLCRFNAKGRFNVPFGRPATAPYFPEREMLAFSAKGSSATFEARSFEWAMGQARAGDVVYCDPPYVALSETASFDAYAAGGFSFASQQELARLSAALGQRGITVVVSNHDTPETRALYEGALLIELNVRRSISADGGKRGKTAELFAVYGPATPAAVALNLAQSSGDAGQDDLARKSAPELAEAA